MHERTEKLVDRDDRVHLPAEERPMHVDAFALLSIVMAVLLMLSQGFVIVWLDLL